MTLKQAEAIMELKTRRAAEIFNGWKKTWDHWKGFSTSEVRATDERKMWTGFLLSEMLNDRIFWEAAAVLAGHRGHAIPNGFVNVGEYEIKQ